MTGSRWALVRAVARRRRRGVVITDPPHGVLFESDVEVTMRDGVVLRVNVFRPDDGAPHPVLLCAHPYGKDALPRRRRWGRGYRVPLQYRLMRSAPLTHSAWTTWEAPDPGHWVPRGYVVVNADLRGWGTSDGVPGILSAQEGEDVHDLVEWAARQPWSTGRIGMSGVSYLAISQWRAAATQPPHLAAICPWEGFTDLYRDFARPGGVRENGFLSLWSASMRRRSHGAVDLGRQVRERDLDDDWYAGCDPDLEAIRTPALVCASFSDHALHSRGSFAAFNRIGSQHAWLYTHRRPKWQAYYSPEGLAVQEQFFDHFLAGIDTGVLHRPPVHLEINEDRDTVCDTLQVDSWPPSGTEWTTLHCALDDGGQDALQGVLHGAAPDRDGSQRFTTRSGRASFRYFFDTETDIVGPMVACLTVSVDGDDDFPLFVAIRKFRAGAEVQFEGSYGFRRDVVTHGMLRVVHRSEDPDRTLPHRPFHSHDRRVPLAPGESADVRIELHAAATRFLPGDELRLDVQGHWIHPRNPWSGQFPAGYRARSHGTCTLHLGPQSRTQLSMPILSRRTH